MTILCSKQRTLIHIFRTLLSVLNKLYITVLYIETRQIWVAYVSIRAIFSEPSTSFFYVNRVVRTRLSIFHNYRDQSKWIRDPMSPITNHLYGCTTAQIGTFEQTNTNVSRQPGTNSGESQTIANGATHQSEVSNINTLVNNYPYYLHQPPCTNPLETQTFASGMPQQSQVSKRNLFENLLP